MKTLNIISCLFGLSLSAMAFASASEECPAKWEGLARDYVKANETLVSIYEDETLTNRQLDAETLKFCGSIDLDQGSWNLRRETSFCNDRGDKFVLYTYGDLWCEGEVVLGIKSLTLTQEPAAN